jgi:hypothetical protein
MIAYDVLERDDDIIPRMSLEALMSLPFSLKLCR